LFTLVTFIQNLTETKHTVKRGLPLRLLTQSSNCETAAKRERKWGKLDRRTAKRTKHSAMKVIGGCPSEGDEAFCFKGLWRKVGFEKKMRLP
jgi:hypothetical protein